MVSARFHGPVTRRGRGAVNVVLYCGDNCIVLPTLPADHFDFVCTCRKVLGYSPLRAADASRHEMSDTERWLSCLAAFRDQKAPAGFAPYLLPHVSFSIFLVADDQDMRAVLSYCAGMPFLTADTKLPGVTAAVLTGTLAQWRDAVASGSARNVETTVRLTFNRLLRLFRSAKLDVWGDYRTREAPDKTLLLEYKHQ